MSLSLINCQTLLPKINRDFGIRLTDWATDSIEWIAEAVEIIGCGGSLIKTHKVLTIEEFKHKLPCSVEAILGIKYKGERLPERNSINSTETDFLKTLPTCVDHYYTINGNYINTSFETGSITVFYLTLSVDENGYPCIPDRVKVKNAITWYLMMMLMGKGYKHPVFDYSACEQRWNKYYPQAQNDLKFHSLDRAWALKDARMNLVPNISREEEFFNGRN